MISPTLCILLGLPLGTSGLPQWSPASGVCPQLLWEPKHQPHPWQDRWLQPALWQAEADLCPARGASPGPCREAHDLRQGQWSGNGLVAWCWGYPRDTPQGTHCNRASKCPEADQQAGGEIYRQLFQNHIMILFEWKWSNVDHFMSCFILINKASNF